MATACMMIALSSILCATILLVIIGAAAKSSSQAISRLCKRLHHFLRRTTLRRRAIPSSSRSLPSHSLLYRQRFATQSILLRLQIGMRWILSSTDLGKQEFEEQSSLRHPSSPQRFLGLAKLSTRRSHQHSTAQTGSSSETATN